MNILEVSQRFNTHEKCLQYLELQRWPDGAICPYCNSSKYSKKKSSSRYTCLSCNYSYSVTVGTIFESTKLDLSKWFLAIALILGAKKGISSLQLSRHLGINKNTAWYLQSRIRKAMREELFLEGIIEVDETFVGGSVTNMHQSYIKKHKIYPGGMEHKTPVLGMIQRKGKIIMEVLPKATKAHIRPILSERISTSSTLITDGFGPYRTLGKEFKKHVSINHEKKQKKQGKYNLSSIEGFWAMLKRAIIGVYHNITLKHLQSYVDEIAFKFNYSKENGIFRILINKLLKNNIAIN